jgi:tetratricopeptide (TPR) repeat protein
VCAQAAVNVRPGWGARRWLVEAILGVLLATVVAGAYWVKIRPAPEVTRADAAMKAGLDALYTRGDAEAAVTHFRKALELKPTHYGATLQLAKALDAAGRPQEARPLFEKMKALAEDAGDKATLAIVTARLAKQDVMSESAMQGALLNRGLDALYKRNDPVAAAALFRQVLDRNPDHYGANFQLAKALDRDGERAEARVLWEKVLKMAEGYNDQANLAIIRSRLAQNP